MKGTTKKSSLFWKQVEGIRATKLCVSAIESAGAQVKYLRAMTTPNSKLSTINQARMIKLENLRTSAADFITNLNQEQKANANDMLKKGYIRKYQPIAIKFVTQQLKAARLQPAEAQRIQKDWEANFREITNIQTITEISRYVQKRTTQLKKMEMAPAILFVGKSSSSTTSDLAHAFCMILLLITSILLILMVLAIFLSIFSRLTPNEILDAMLEEICG
jgi:hypothetical protein